MKTADILSLAKKHSIRRELAAPDFAGGRYYDDINCDFMSRMGIWVENFSLHAVVTESLLWGHRDIKVLFPNWDKRNSAAFRSLRTKGAFLVDAACSGGRAEYVRVQSERGGIWQMVNPWEKCVDDAGNVYSEEVVAIPMDPAAVVYLKEYR